MIFDLHTHCKFSADSGADPRDMIISAIHGGLNAICFTDHMDYDFPYENITFDFDTDEYFQTLTELKKEFYKKILITQITCLYTGAQVKLILKAGTQKI